MGVRSAVPKGAAAKVAAGRRRAASGKHARQRERTTQHKLNRINRDLAKSGRGPLSFLPDGDPYKHPLANTKRMEP